MGCIEDSVEQVKPRFARLGPALIAVFMASCIFGNYELSALTHLYLSHVVTVVFFVLSVLCWVFGAEHKRLERLFSTGRLPRGRLLRHPYVLLSAFGYVVWRVATSIPNPFFPGDLSKMIVLGLGVVAYGILDPDRLSFRLISWLLPVMVALASGLSIVRLLAQGELFTGRLAVEAMGSAIGLGYISGTLTAFLLYVSDRIEGRLKRVAWVTVSGILILTLILSFGRNGFFALVIIWLAYTKSTGRQYRRHIGPVIGVIIILAALGSTKIENFTVVQRFGGDASLSGRGEIWESYVQTATQSFSALMFGDGIGSSRPVSQGTGYFMRDPHNIYIEIVAISGLAGLCVYLLLLRRVYSGLKNVEDKSQRSVFIALFLAYIVTELFDTHWRQSAVLWYTSYLIHLVGGIGIRTGLVGVRKMARLNSWKVSWDSGNRAQH